MSEIPSALPQWPTVSMIVLNYNGLEHLKSCLPSLLKLNYPAESLELMVVDNASTDGSVDFVQREFPNIRLVRNDENVGFATANNKGARLAKGQYVIFLNNDMWVDPQFVRGLVKALQSDPAAVCAAAKILNWDGTRYDFVRPEINFAGHAFQVAINEPVRKDEFNVVEPILFACGGAMLADRQIFVDLGGFDEDYFIYFEDVDFGWRLWVTGYKVVFAPDAVVHHRHHGTMQSFADYRKQVLYKRNSLCTLIKNYSDENFGKVVPAALLGAVNGIVQTTIDKGYLKPDEFLIRNKANAQDSTLSMDRFEASTLIAIHDVVEQLPSLMKKRHFVQTRRKRSDADIFPYFGQPFRIWPEVDGRTKYRVVNAFGVSELFASQPRRVLVISSDILPLPGLPTVGSGLRAWGLAQGLKSRGHRVIIAMPRNAIEGREHLVSQEIRDFAWDYGTLATLARSANPDVILACGWHILDALPIDGLNVPIMVDQHGPHMMERDYQKFGSAQENERQKLNAMRKADFFSCAGKKQMTYFQSWLDRAGWSEHERHDQSAAIPVSLSPDLPERHSGGELTFVYGGVFLPWQDPSVGLTELVKAIERHGCGQLDIYGGKHPYIPIDAGLFGELMKRLETSSHVAIQGMVSHDELIRRYTRAHVAMDVMKRNPERELAFTTRTVEYLWCGLPVIYHDYAELSEYIREYDAGWLVDPEDRVALAAVLDDILTHPEQIERKSKNAQRLVRERLTWDRTIEPLQEFITHASLRRKPEPRSQGISVSEARSLLEKAKYRYRTQGLKSVVVRGASLPYRWLSMRVRARRGS